MDFYQADIGDARLKKLLPDDCQWRNGVVVRSTNWLGDACMTLPAIYKIRQLLPENAKLNIVCPANLAGFWQTIPWVDQVIALKNKRAGAAEKAQIRLLNCGVGVILPNSFGSALDLCFANIPIRLGRGGRGRSWLLTHRLPSWKRIAGQDKHHQLREYLEIAAACGATAWDDRYPPGQPKVDPRGLAEKGFNEQAATLALAPGAKFGPAKQWPLTHYGELGKAWLAKGGELLIVGAPDEVEICEKVKIYAGGGVNLAGKTSLQELMYIFSRVQCSVVNDSGAMHLAAAMGGKGVALFGSTDPRATGPLGGRWKVIWNRIECSPCLKKTCEIPGKNYACLTGISAQSVMQHLEELENV